MTRPWPFGRGQHFDVPFPDNIIFQFKSSPFSNRLAGIVPPKSSQGMIHEMAMLTSHNQAQPEIIIHAVAKPFIKVTVSLKQRSLPEDRRLRKPAMVKPTRPEGGGASTFGMLDPRLVEELARAAHPVTFRIGKLCRNSRQRTWQIDVVAV